MKIEPNELRIGNFVKAKSPEKDKYEQPVAVSIEYLQMFCMNPKRVHFKPIPITRYVLPKAGFRLEYESMFTIKYTMKDASIGYDWDQMNGWMFRYYGNKIKCDYVHQLQNLYYALTGNELEFKM